ncbi:MAG: copper chaperone CopZ [Eubacteriales bacterium]|nr:copper chaperone CopZ [Eubacteriales bacterium]MDD3199288.1 copper chaperone CopZ [Eubacteriales bacterium]MDD4121287.1 copper chaperone CopZ [Eubacteriales bacterium]MDD4629418.1 copper chaperone CopZ [Eubacteriales bacterium]
MKKKVLLKVEGMSCSHCIEAVKKAAGGLGGVSDVYADLESKTATVEYDSNEVSLESIKEAIEDQGYDVHELDI